MHVCKCMIVFVCVHDCVYVFTCMQVYACACVYMHLHICLRVSACVCSLSSRVCILHSKFRSSPLNALLPFFSIFFFSFFLCLFFSFFLCFFFFFCYFFNNLFIFLLSLIFIPMSLTLCHLAASILFSQLILRRSLNHLLQRRI